MRSKKYQYGQGYYDCLYNPHNTDEVIVEKHYKTKKLYLLQVIYF